MPSSRYILPERVARVPGLLLVVLFESEKSSMKVMLKCHKETIQREQIHFI